MENKMNIYELSKSEVHELGVPLHVKGYLYLASAIANEIENPDCLKNISKEVYPFIAERYNVTPAQVEREIRHAIQIAWDRGTLSDYFGGADKKPTNVKFITSVTNNLRLKI